MEQRISKLEEDYRDLQKRVTEIEKDKKLQEYQYNNIIDNLQELKSDVKEIKQTPSRRWDLIITGSITAIIGGIIALIFG